MYCAAGERLPDRSFLALVSVSSGRLRMPHCRRRHEMHNCWSIVVCEIASYAISACTCCFPLGWQCFHGASKRIPWRWRSREKQGASARGSDAQACHSSFCLIRDGAWEEVSWLNVRFAPDNLVTPWQKRAVSNGPRPPLLLFRARLTPCAKHATLGLLIVVFSGILSIGNLRVAY